MSPHVPHARRDAGTRAAIAFLIACLLASLTAMATALPVFAASCGDFLSANYNDGWSSANGHEVTGVSADLAIPGSASFKLCSPDDNAGQNAVAAQIGVKNGNGAWARMGVYRCVNDQVSGQVCDGVLRYFAEVHGATGIGGYAFDNLGTVSYGTTYNFKIIAVDGRDDWKFYVNNSLKATWSVGGLVSGSSDIFTQYFAEIHDRGDVIGSAGDTFDIGSLHRRDPSGTYYNENPSGSCNFAGNSYMNCVKNGSNAFYFYRP